MSQEDSGAHDERVPEGLDRQGRDASPALIEGRRQADLAAQGRPLADGVSFAERTAGSVRVGVFDPPGVLSASVVFYLHGGGFRQGTVRSYATFTSHLAVSIGAQLVSVDYRLAPEYPFPAGLEDALRAYQWLDGHLDPEVAILVAGDSAGGGLAASVLLESRRLDVRRPAAAVLISPWVDLRNAADSFTTNAPRDAVFPLSGANDAAEMYLAGWDVADTRVSPLLGDWSSQPPMLVLASRTESLRDDAVALTAVARRHAVQAELKLFADTFHGWWMECPATAESREVVDDVGRFFRPYLD